MLVENSIKRLISIGKTPGIRVTLTDHNQNRIVESIDYLKKLGIRSAAFIPMEIPFYLEDNIAQLATDPEIVYNEYIRAYEYTYRLYCNEGYAFHLLPITMILEGVMSGGRFQGCGMGRGFFSIGTSGNIHSCQRVRTDEFYIGNIYDNDIFYKLDNVPESKKGNSVLSALLSERTTDVKGNSCANCEVLAFCAGGCAAAAWAQFKDKDIGSPNINDSMYHEKCYYTKKLIKRLFWDYIERPKKDDKYFKYLSTIAPIRRNFWM
ncbi:MAG: SPASM domain-containing protein [Candidatus Omnitrophota bacterium]